MENTDQKKNEIKIKNKGFYVVLILALFMVIGNPNKQEFMAYIEENINNEIQESGKVSNSYIEQLIGSLSAKITSNAINPVVKRENFILFSIYKLEAYELDYTYIGVLKNFFQLKDYLGLEKINESFKDFTTVYYDTIEIKEDYYHYIKLDIDGIKEVIIDISGFNGTKVETLLVDEENFEKYKNWSIWATKDDKLKVYNDFSKAIDNDYEIKGVLGEGRYYLIIDNTDQGGVIPPMNFSDDSVSMEVEVKVED